jgi:acetyl coenzyme A synthetase (ADP forming)-like protein
MSEPTPAETRTSLEPIFSPRSVAVIGASRNRESIGFALLHNLVMGEFQGTIFPINPHAGSIHSLKAYPRIGAVPDPVDLAVVAVPKHLVLGVVDECIAAGVRGLVTITAGFAETGPEGAALERRLCERVRDAGVRMVGPNCMGVINTDAGIAMNATFAPTPARPGTVGFVSQSGALGVAILNAAADLGIGLTQFASMGNKADVSANDLAEYWEDDPGTRVICMYLESFGNPRKFTEIAKRVSHKKPILVVKSGRTAEGARAATSHTGAIAGADVTVSAFLRQCGVLRANTIDELFDVTRALDRCPLPAGNRVGIVTNAGGPAIMATDACVNLGLEMAELSADTRSTLQSFLPAEASVGNPIDMIASAAESEYARALTALLEDDGVDMVMVVNVTPLLSNPIDILDSVTTAARGSSKPVVAVMMATEEFYEEARTRDHAPPVYRFPEPAARVLAQLDRYAAWRRRPEEDPSGPFEVDDEAVARLLAANGDGYVPAEEAIRVLELYGVPVVSWRRTAASGAAVHAAADDLGYPLVIKAVAPELIHKSDVGAVRVDVRTPEELARAVAEIETAVGAAGHQVEGWLLQELLRGGHEVIFGISTDPRFGPLLMFGLGGKYVEVFRDVRFGVPPLTPVEAAEMVRGIRGLPLLEGVRGEEPADLGLLEEVLLRLSQLTQRHPSIQELDLNPFLAAPGRDGSKALDARIRVGG